MPVSELTYDHTGGVYKDRKLDISNPKIFLKKIKFFLQLIHGKSQFVPDEKRILFKVKKNFTHKHSITENEKDFSISAVAFIRAWTIMETKKWLDQVK